MGLLVYPFMATLQMWQIKPFVGNCDEHLNPNRQKNDKKMIKKMCFK